MTNYEKMSEFGKHFSELIQDKKTFVFESTTYSKTIKCNGKTINYSSDGICNYHQLNLINKVRKDARNFLDKFKIKYNENFDYCFLSEYPPETIVSKIDIRSAYWETAKKFGLISEETTAYLYNNFKKTPEMKAARLKALGSLATRKEIRHFASGEEVHELRELREEPTRHIYFFICAYVADLMKHISLDLPGAFYYYWDCVFVHYQAEDLIVDYIANHGYSTKTKKTIIRHVTLGNQEYLSSISDNKLYIIPRKNHSLIYEKN